jgi:hypothetical protein
MRRKEMGHIRPRDKKFIEVVVTRVPTPQVKLVVEVMDTSHIVERLLRNGAFKRPEPMDTGHIVERLLRNGAFKRAVPVVTTRASAVLANSRRRRSGVNNASGLAPHAAHKLKSETPPKG